MNWIQNLIPNKNGFLEGAAPETIMEVEEKLKITFPERHKEFLMWIDGGKLSPEYIIYSAGNGIHPSETLLSANWNRDAGVPFFFIAREAGEEFVFRFEDMNQADPPVYIYLHESETIQKVSDSFVQFIKQVMRIRQLHKNSFS